MVEMSRDELTSVMSACHPKLPSGVDPKRTLRLEVVNYPLDELSETGFDL